MHQYTKRCGKERAWQLQQQTGGNVWNLLIHLVEMKSPCSKLSLVHWFNSRSASNFQLKNYEVRTTFKWRKHLPNSKILLQSLVFCLQACLSDIKLAIEAGYPTNMVYKLYIRQCKCLLELGHIADAQTAFDKAVDAIDRWGCLLMYKRLKTAYRLIIICCDAKFKINFWY